MNGFGYGSMGMYGGYGGGYGGYGGYGTGMPPQQQPEGDPNNPPEPTFVDHLRT